MKAVANWPLLFIQISGGGSVVEGNFMVATVMESGDHGYAPSAMFHLDAP